MQQSLKNFNSAINNGSLNAIEQLTKTFYEAVKTYCYANNVINDVKDINYDFDIATRTGRVYTNNHVVVFNEMGTGIVGSNNPHPNPKLEWKYDINNHGESGWTYRKKDGSYGWTKGLPAKHMFYDAFEEIKLLAKDKVKIEIIKLNKDLY